MVATDARPSSRSPQPTREADCISALCCHFIMNGVLVVLYSLLLAAVNDELEGEKVRATVAASPARVCVSGNPPLGAGVITASAIHGVDILFLSCSWLVRGSAQCGVPGDDVRLWGSVAGSVGIANSIVDFLLASAVCLTDSHHRVLFLVIGSILGAVLSLFEVAWGAFGASASSDSKLGASPLRATHEHATHEPPSASSLTFVSVVLCSLVRPLLRHSRQRRVPRTSSPIP